MTRFWKLAALMLVSVMATAAQAAPTLQVTSVSATAQGDTRRPVTVEVTIKNSGSEPSEPGVVTLTLTPKVGMGSKPTNPGGGPTMYDPYKLDQQVPAIPPGRDVTVSFKTPYDAKSSFKHQTSTFRAGNIDPTGGDVTVSMAAELRH